MPKPPLMPGTDIMVVDTDMVDTMGTPDTMAVTVVVTDTVWDTTDTDTVWDTVATTDTDLPVLTVMLTTTARGPLMPNPLLKPHPRPMLKPLLTMVDTTVMVDTAVDTDTVDTMAVDTVMVDTAVDTHTVMANRNCFRLEYLAIFLITPLWSFRNLHYCPLQYY